MQTNNKQPSGRPPTRQRAIISELRRGLLAGRWPPGGRLPTRREFCAEFDASMITVQQALDQLVAEGFVEARGRNGTFVVDRPPHLFSVVLAFPVSAVTSRQNRFWAALEEEALRLRQSSFDIHVHHEIDSHPGNAMHNALAAAVENGRFAGLIFPSSPHDLQRSPLLKAPGVARVAIMSATDEFPNIGAVILDGASWRQKALDHLVARGRRRIALLTTPRLESTGWESAFASRGLELRPYWIQSTALSAVESARNLAHLLFRPGRDEHPDGLIITDDNLVEAATGGVVAAGVRVPTDLEIVAHCNFPWPTPSVVPARRLGFDARLVLAACLNLLARQRAGEPPTGTLVPAVFEDELDTVPQADS